MSAYPATEHRWRTETSDVGLTWGLKLDGEPLLRAIRRHAALDGAEILEIGPGYGRLLRALVARGQTFSSYVGLDISAHWTQVLAAEFADHSGVSFIQGSVEEADALLSGRRFDLIVSFLTWKHLCPDFSMAARRCGNLLAPGAKLMFDLPESAVASDGAIESETGCWTRRYTRDEVCCILAPTNLRLVTFDEVEHAPQRRRLLVVAEAGR